METLDKNLEVCASKYDSSICKGWRKLLLTKKQYLYKKMKPFFLGTDALEIGCGEGLLTQYIIDDFKNLDILEGAKFFIDFIGKKEWANKVHFLHGLYPEYNPEKKYDFVFFSHILEHLEKPIEALAALNKFLKPGGRAFIAVPNALSWHRQIGVKMGLIPTCDSLNAQDIDLGHLRVYTPELFKEHIAQAGLKLIHFGGNMLKPISNRQIEEQWSDELIEACFALGDDYPQFCSEIFAIVTL